MKDPLISGNSPLQPDKRSIVNPCCKKSALVNVYGNNNNLYFFTGHGGPQVAPCCPDTPTPPSSCPSAILEYDGPEGTIRVDGTTFSSTDYTQAAGGKITLRLVNDGTVPIVLPAGTPPPVVTTSGFSSGSFSFSPNAPFGPLTIAPAGNLDFELELTPGEAAGTNFQINFAFTIAQSGCDDLVLSTTITGQVQGVQDFKVFDAANGSVTEVPDNGTITDSASIGTTNNSFVRYDNLGSGASVLTNILYTTPAPPSISVPSSPAPIINVTTLNPGGALVVSYDVDALCPAGTYNIQITATWTDAIGNVFTHTTNGVITVS